METAKDDYSSKESDVEEKSGDSLPVVKRGRGRPSKNPDGAAKKVAALANGAAAGVVVPRKRGRPLKGGKKSKNTVIATGRGRGRPKNPVAKSPESPKKDAAKKSPSKGSKKPGRPKKGVQSDEDDGDDSESDVKQNSDDEEEEEEERRPVGRPSTGAVNLNIVRTGRGQGRSPKKPVATTAASLKRSAETSPNGSVVPKKRGRPPMNKDAGTTTATEKNVNKKPRGRPSTKPNSSANDSQDEDSQDDESEKKDSLVVEEDDIVSEDDGVEFLDAA